VQKRQKAPRGSRRRPDAAARPICGGTKRKYLAAVQSFAAYLREVGVLTTNPLREVSPPPAADPRCHFLEMPDVMRLVEGASQPLRAIYALAYGAGLEVSAILRLPTSILRPVRCVHGAPKPGPVTGLRVWRTGRGPSSRST